MSIVTERSLTWCVMIAGSLLTAMSLHAQVPLGTWVRKPVDSLSSMTMKVETCCGGGRRLTYHLVVGNTTTDMLVESPFDGSEVPVMVDGKPSGETMAIKTVDSHHVSTVITMNGQPFGKGVSTLSADGKTITVSGDLSAGGGTVTKYTEVWVKQ